MDAHQTDSEGDLKIWFLQEAAARIGADEAGSESNDHFLLSRLGVTIQDSGMLNEFHRREFLWKSGLAAAGLALYPLRSVKAIEPFQRTGPPRLLLSLAAYSFRQYFKDSDDAGKVEASRRIDLFRFIDFCAEQGCEGAELTSYYFPREVSAEFLNRLKRHAFLRGVEVSGTAVGNTFTHPAGADRDKQIALVKRWVDHAQILSAPHIRVFAGAVQKGTSKDDTKKLCREALEECCAYAGGKGVFLGLENHGGIVAEPDDLLDIVRAINSPWLGINLDSGNFHTADPYADFERCAPYAVNVQLKAEVQVRGQKKQAADLAKFVAILKAAKYQGYVALEYESAEDPWKAVPPLLKQMRELFQSPI